jgi:hypothetical protein
MVTSRLDPHPERARWLRRSAAAAIATVLLGITGTGLAVGIISVRQHDAAGQAATTGDDSGSGSTSDDNGSSSDNGGTSDNGSTSNGSGLGSAQQNVPAQGGSHGS